MSSGLQGGVRVAGFQSLIVSFKVADGRVEAFLVVSFLGELVGVTEAAVRKQYPRSLFSLRSRIAVSK